MKMAFANEIVLEKDWKKKIHLVILSSSTSNHIQIKAIYTFAIYDSLSFKTPVRSAEADLYREAEGVMVRNIDLVLKNWLWTLVLMICDIYILNLGLLSPPIRWR